ncbi:MAG: succinylglutamate desuccinylase/aspartoacylase family protein [Candidatus Saccharimonas sp.]
MKLLIIGATHGNELLGTKLYARLLQKRSPLLEHVDFIIGNPRAYTQKVRYTEQDLNRSYQSSGDTYEEQRARAIQRYISETKPDLVIDMHTTSCIQPNCIILSGVSSEIQRKFLRASHISAVLQVQPMGDIATLGDNVVAYEVPNSQIDIHLLDAITGDLERLVAGEGGYTHKQLFKMSDKIYKRDVTPEQARSFVNFELHTELGFVPIMTGENSYKKFTDYLGFKSPAPEEIEV